MVAVLWSIMLAVAHLSRTDREYTLRTSFIRTVKYMRYSSDNVKCFDGRLSTNNVTLHDLQPNKMCAVKPSFHGDDTIFEQRICFSSGCHVNASSSITFWSLTSEELEKERKLRARARELNEGLPNGERLYVVFRQQVIVRKDRKNRRGGGICALLLSHLSFKLVQFDSSSFSADVLCFDIIGDILCYTRFVLVYRPPNHSVFEDDELCGLLSDLCSVPLNVVLLGDFNLDIDWSTVGDPLPRQHRFRKFASLFSHLNLEQFIREPTCGDSILDLVFSSPNFVSNVVLGPPLGTSDHNIVIFSVNVPAQDMAGKEFRCFPRANVEAINRELSSVNWFSVFNNYDSIDDVYHRFLDVIRLLIDRFVPIKKLCSVVESYPRHIRNLFEHRERLFKLTENPLSSDEYKKVNRKFISHLKRYLAFKERKLSTCRNMKNLFSYDLQPNKMCAVKPSFHGDDTIFEQRICFSSGCHVNASSSITFCCCATHACNTVSFYKLSGTSFYLAMYVGHCIILLIVIAKLLTLLIIYCGHRLKCFNDTSRYSKKIHLDLTQLVVQPRMSVSEVNYVIDTITKGSTSNLSVSLSSISVRSVLTYSTNDRITYRESKEQAMLIGVDDCSKMEDILAALSVPIAIYGDIHGQYSDIWRWFHVNGWPPETRTLFLGDYVDRGRHSTETYNFYSELKARYPKTFKKLYSKIVDVFSVMPIACLISSQIICMHGGLSPRLQTVAEIAALQRPLVKDSKPGTHIDILWSDPHPSKWTYEPNVLRDPSGVGLGYLFGPIQIKRFVRKNDVEFLQHLMRLCTGFKVQKSQQNDVLNDVEAACLPARSPGYRVQDNVGSMGASVVVDENGTIDIVRIQVGEQLKLKRQRYKMDKGDSYRNCGRPKLKKRTYSDEKYS
ncbi:hypothetical protein GCK32_005671 [Trichostrongylus colubriformis]|uniref:protein-serine/threonine phosphatase n=1 Tax=Trichostrongylus colubriformis TaxID=6319 RepID=A0AAN8IHZ9_TRICO